LETRYHAELTRKPFTRSIFLKTALNYAQRGIPVFPLKGKRPLTAHGWQDASTDASRITAMFNAAPNATGIGIPTGGFSGLVVPDKDGDSEEVRRIWDSLPPTLEVATGRASGVGRHRYFRVPKGTKVKSRDLAEGLELKADGCYVVAPPSVHPSGARYRWVPGHSEIAPLPDDLIEADPMPQPSRRREGPTIGLETGPIPEGTRNETLTRIAGRLHDGTRDAGALASDLMAVNETRCSPPLGENEVVGIAKSIARREPCKPTVEVSPRVLEVAEHLASIERPVKGMGGATGWSIYRAGLELLRRYGREHPDGLILSVDVRTWAQMAGTTHTSVRRFIGRTSLIRVARKGSGRRSGEFVFVAPGVDKGTTKGHRAFHSSSLEVGIERSGTPSALSRTLERLRWGPGRIGKSRAAILHKLVECGSLCRKELASKLGRKPESLRAPLKWLVDAGLIHRVSRGVYDVPGDIQEGVEDARQIAGEPEADRLQIARHDRERDAYRRRNTIKPTPHLANRKADGFISELERVPTAATMPEKVDGIYVHDALCGCYLCDIPPGYAKPWRGA
jgi:Bifunctional DNA primase/polymerase, N-terminal/Primase C terminal 1 (PriCT-1)